jgi:hypothetical protein
MIQTWLPVYQQMVELALGDFFNTRYSGNTRDIEQTYEEALRYAVE